MHPHVAPTTIKSTNFSHVISLWSSYEFGCRLLIQMFTVLQQPEKGLWSSLYDTLRNQSLMKGKWDGPKTFGKIVRSQKAKISTYSVFYHVVCTSLSWQFYDNFSHYINEWCINGLKHEYMNKIHHKYTSAFVCIFHFLFSFLWWV